MKCRGLSQISTVSMLISLSANAQTPVGTAFTYQGFLVRDGGPVTDTCDFEFRLYNVMTGGTVLATDTANNTAVESGAFTAPDVDFGAGHFNGSDARWFEIRILDCDGDAEPPTTLTPRLRMTVSPHALALPGLWTQQNATSPNLIGGYAGNDVGAGVSGATIGGGGLAGSSNRAGGNFSTVSGGRRNEANYFSSTVGGGDGNVADGSTSTIAGGRESTASGQFSFVGGGDRNDAEGDGSTVSGGFGNVASGAYSAVGGGRNNRASAKYGTIAGGGLSNEGDLSTYNIVSDDYGTIGGGGNNHAGNVDGDPTTARYATVSGGVGNQATGPWSTIGGGDRNTSTTGYATVSGGVQNNGTASMSTIGGGYSNSASAQAATVGGGWDNEAGGSNATVAGGRTNQATASWASVGGGDSNVASGAYATVAGGSNNTASANLSTVGGGQFNVASGIDATVPGGRLNVAQGAQSFAAGSSARALHDGTFVWSGDGFTQSTGPNQFIVKSSGGIWLSDCPACTVSLPAGRFINTTTGAYLSSAGVWTNSSDQRVKENVVPVSGRYILDRVADLPVSRWNFNVDDPKVQHIGPMAQDFHAAFGLGQDMTSIATLDADGVALAAIQGLYEIAQEKECELDLLRTEKDEQIAQLGARLAALENLLERMSRGAKGEGR